LCVQSIDIVFYGAAEPLTGAL